MSDVINRGRWKPGQSGNPSGVSKRVLTDTLALLSEFDSYDDIANKRLLAQLIWEGLVMGEIRMLSGRTMELRGKEWVELVKWFYTHLDGTYRSRQQEDEKAAKTEPPTVQTANEMPPQEMMKDAPSALTLNPSPEGTSPPAPLQSGEGSNAGEENDGGVRVDTSEGQEQGLGSAQPAPQDEGREGWQHIVQQRFDAAKAAHQAEALREAEQAIEAGLDEEKARQGLVKLGEDWVTPEHAKEWYFIQRNVMWGLRPEDDD